MLGCDLGDCRWSFRRSFGARRGSSDDAATAILDIAPTAARRTVARAASRGGRCGRHAYREDFRTIPHDFAAEGDKVVVLTTRELGGEATEGPGVLTLNDAGKLITFEALGDTAQLDRVFAKYANAATDELPRAARLSGSRGGLAALSYL